MPFPAWDEARAAALDEPGRLLYRSNLLGSDLRITNYGGGNTSAKIVQKDPLGGHDTPVLWVKGSGGDLGSMTLDGFATLYMDKLIALKGLYRGHAHEDEMVGLLPHCTFKLNPRAASIDTPLHAYLPFALVDHMHPDAVIAIAAMADGERIARQVFEGTVGWLPWLRPGYELGLRLADHVARHPGLRGLVLGGHGLCTWGDDARACYDNTVGVIAQAQAWLQRERLARQVPSFGGVRHQALPQAAQDATLARVLPVLRGLASQTGPKLAHVDQQPAVMELVNSRDLEPLAAQGTSCPDHFLRTKIRPLVLDEAVYALQGAALSEAIEGKLAAYRAGYRAYHERCKRADSPAVRDPNPVIVPLPRIGMVSLARDKATARIAGEFYVNAINVMREAAAIDRYVGLPEQEAFDIEYWLLEEAKLQRLPKPRPLVGRVALVTGGAGGIGRAIARRLLALSAVFTLPALAADKIALVVKSLGNGFFDAAHQGALEAAKELKDVEIIYTGPANATAEGQIEIINSLVAQNVKAIVISANDPDALVPALKKAMARGIKVVSFDSGVRKDGRLMHLNPSSTPLIGEKLVKMTQDAIGPKGEIAVLSATAQATNQNAWIAAMKGVLAQPAYSGLKLVSVVYGDDQTDKSYREAQGLFKSAPRRRCRRPPRRMRNLGAARRFLMSYPNLKAIIAPTTVGVAAAAKAVQDDRKVGTLFVTGLGLPSEMAGHVKSGAVKSFAIWNPIDLGYSSIMAAHQFVTG